MKLLLDECLPQDLRHHLVGHEPFTVGYMEWSGIKNGSLLRIAAANDFKALITTDAGIPHQHNPAALPLSIVVVRARSNSLPDILPYVPALLELLPTLPDRSVAYVP